MSSGLRPVCHCDFIPADEGGFGGGCCIGLYSDSGVAVGHGLSLTGRIEGCIYDDIMSSQKRPPQDPKAAALRSVGALHRHPEAVQDEAFLQHAFFDRRDRVQVKYEMVRRHRVESRSVTEVAAAFGVSRQAFYAAEAAVAAAGLPGLLPRPPGPRHAHKCTDPILDFAAAWQADHPQEPAAQLAAAVQERFGLTIHPRSILRALVRRQKRGSSQRGQP